MAKTGTQFDELPCLIGLWSSNWGLLVQKVLKYKLLQTYKQNKLGQRQSQTPFSSAFRVQKDFRSKKVLGPKKFWIQKNFESNLWIQKL